MCSARNSNSVQTFKSQDAVKYVEDLLKDQELCTLIRHTFETKSKDFHDLSVNDVRQVIKTANDPELKLLYQQMLETLKIDGETILLATTDDRMASTNLRKSSVLFAEKKNGHFDIIVVNAVQTKQIDWGKITTLGIGSALSGATLGAVLGGPFGTFLGGVTACLPVVGKAYKDYKKEMPEAVYGYIFKELQEKHMLIVRDDNFVAPNNEEST